MRLPLRVHCAGLVELHLAVVKLVPQEAGTHTIDNEDIRRAMCECITHMPDDILEDLVMFIFDTSRGVVTAEVEIEK